MNSPKKKKKCINRKLKFSLLFTLCLIIINLYSCKTPPKNVKIPALFSIYQDGKTIEIKLDNNEYTIKKKSFSFRFFFNKEEAELGREGILYAPYHADTYYKFKIGRDISTLPIFSEEGFEVPEQWGIETIFIKDSSFHKIDITGNSKRLFNLESEESMVYLEWVIKEMDSKGEIYKIEDFPWDAIYLIFYVEQNNNNIIDEKELFKMILRLE